MGHIKKKRPRRGSLAVWPRVRARAIRGHVETWPLPKTGLKAPKLLGFCGYKAGMTSAIVVDNRPKALTKGEEVKYPSSVVETPPIKPFSIRLYQQTPYGLHLISEAFSENLDKNLLRTISTPKKRISTVEKLKANVTRATKVTVVIHTQPQTTGFAKKTPDIFEIPVAGGSIEEQFNYAVSILGKEVKFEDIFKAGEFVDTHGVTKGKGFQGMIKRYGIKLERTKAEKGRRHRATMGPITPPKVGWWIAQSGQMGSHQRTEYNRQILSIGLGKEKQVTPNGGFVNYGVVSGQYALLAGSVPGAKRRLITMTHPARPRKNLFAQAPEIRQINVRSQQG